MTDETETTEPGSDYAPTTDASKGPPAPTAAAAPAPLPEPRMVASAPIVRVGSRAMLVPQNMHEAVEVAKLMSRANGLVGPHLFGNPGGCLGVTLQAMAWGMSPYAVARKTYVAAKPEDIAQKIANGEPIPPIEYEAQLVHAVILALAKTHERPAISYEEEGLDMRCVVSATFIGDSSPSVLRSEPLAKLKNPRGSPLWNTKPEQQLAYNAVRDWGRRFCPDVILGVYTRDEMQDARAAAEKPAALNPFEGEGPKQITASVSSPLAAPEGAANAEAAPISKEGDA